MSRCPNVPRKIHAVAEASYDSVPSLAVLLTLGACSTAHRSNRPGYCIGTAYVKQVGCPTADLSNIARPSGLSI